MFTEQLKVRFYETDALGHVNNTVIPAWFETGRLPIFELFGQDLNQPQISAVVANLNVDFVYPVYFGAPVTLHTYINRIGNSSFEIGNEVWQNDKLCAKGTVTMVTFNLREQRPAPLSDEIKARLREYGHPDKPLQS